jgi:outer membrane protein assembly factor BamB
VAGRRAITLEQHGGSEHVVARDVATGRDIWSAANEARYATPLGGEGPRSTPTIAAGRVFTQGATGWLQALDSETGRRLWGTNILALTGAGLPEWGISGSPLVVSNRVYALAGGRDGKSLLVFDATSGILLASGGDGSANYASPAWMNLAGTPQVVVLNGRAVTAHDPVTAAVLWTRPWGTGFPLVANPVEIPGNRLLVSAGYAVGSELLEVVRDSGGTLQASNVWSSKRLKAKFSNPIRIGSLVVGLDDGILAAIDIADGSQRWKEGRYGHGQGVWIDGLLVQMSEEGELIVLEPDANGPHERDRIRVFDRKTWNPIALAGDLLLVRNDREAACYRLGLEAKAATPR